jgi:hypothetical protein
VFDTPAAAAGELGIEVAGVNVGKVQQEAGSCIGRADRSGDDDQDPQDFYEQRLLKPLPVGVREAWGAMARLPACLPACTRAWHARK